MAKKQPEANGEEVPYDLDRKYTVQQVAKDQLPYSTKTIYDLIKTGDLEAHRFGKKKLVITATQLNNYAKKKLLKMKNWNFALSEIHRVEWSDINVAELAGAYVVTEADHPAWHPIAQRPNDDPEAAERRRIAYAALRDWLDEIQHLPQVKLPPPDLENLD